MGGCREGVARLSSEVHSDGTSSRHKLQLEKFHLNLISKFFVLGVVTDQDNLPKETGSSVPLKTAVVGCEQPDPTALLL